MIFNAFRFVRRLLADEENAGVRGKFRCTVVQLCWKPSRISTFSLLAFSSCSLRVLYGNGNVMNLMKTACTINITGIHIVRTCANPNPVVHSPEIIFDDFKQREQRQKTDNSGGLESASIEFVEHSAMKGSRLYETLAPEVCRNTAIVPCISHF